MFNSSINVQKVSHFFHRITHSDLIKSNNQIEFN